MYVCEHVYMRSEDKFAELVLSFHLYMSSGNWTKGIRYVQKMPLPAEPTHWPWEWIIIEKSRLILASSFLSHHVISSFYTPHWHHLPYCNAARQALVRASAILYRLPDSRTESQVSLLLQKISRDFAIAVENCLRHLLMWGLLVIPKCFLSPSPGSKGFNV